MTKRKWSLAVLGLVGCLAALCLWQLHVQKLRRAELRISADRSLQLAHSLKLLALKLDHTKADQIRLRQELTAAQQAKQSSPKAKTVARNKAAGPRQSPNQALAQNPTLHSLYTQTIHDGVRPHWGPLLARLHLSAAEIEQFETLETNHQLSRFDLFASFQAAGSGTNSPAFQQEHSAENSDFETAMQQLLGDRYSDYTAYRDTLPVRDVTNALATQLVTSAPLSASQADQLTATLAASAQNPQGQAIADSIDWTAALEHARSLLQPQQFAALQQMAAAARAQNQVQGALTGAGIDQAQIAQINQVLQARLWLLRPRPN